MRTLRELQLEKELHRLRMMLYDRKAADNKFIVRDPAILGLESEPAHRVLPMTYLVSGRMDYQENGCYHLAVQLDNFRDRVYGFPFQQAVYLAPEIVMSGAAMGQTLLDMHEKVLLAMAEKIELED